MTRNDGENGRPESDAGATMAADDRVPSVAARDDLAGIVDLFGALRREELSEALAELAFKRRTEPDRDAITAAIDLAVEEYFLVPAPLTAVRGVSDHTELEGSEGEEDTPSVLVVGPAAFPSLPEHAEDLPYILDLSERDIERDRVATAVRDRLRREVDAAVGDAESDADSEGAVDADRLETLLDVAYDMEAWAPIETAALRERIVDALDST